MSGYSNNISQSVNAVSDKIELEVKDICKTFGKVVAVKDFNLEVKAGEIIQLDTPERMYSHPNCTFAANFIGDGNIWQLGLRISVWQG
jgi:ABC-type Fe3+/spermidine/putrescine transport system ATPase subunit